MKRRYQVFISHSANRDEEPATQDFLDALVSRVAQLAGFDVLVDQRQLQAGDDWLQRLYAWMGLCDAAVILLSPRAVVRENSTWVPRESNLLMWRKALDPSFVVIPVLVSGLKRSDIAAANPFIADVRLTELQLADGLSDAQKIDRIAESLVGRLTATSHPPVFDPIRVFVEDSLQRFAPHAAVAAALAHHYGRDAWKPYTEAHRNLSAEMVRQSVMPDVDAVITDVSRGSQAEFHLGARLFQALYPMRLPAEPACSLLALCHQQVGQGAVVVNCHDTWAIRMMLRAATGQLEDDLLRAWRIVEVTDSWGDDDQAEVTRVLAAELAEAVLGTGGWEYLCQDADPFRSLVDNLNEFRRESGAPILVCARYTPRWVELATALAEQFPATVFVLWTGAEFPSTLETHGGDFVALRPALASGADRRWQLNYRRRLQLYGKAT